MGEGLAPGKTPVGVRNRGDCLPWVGLWNLQRFLQPKKSGWLARRFPQFGQL